ncbi:hypothetical protein HRbin33_00156 [bacterium HR33]|nr:hypothetical protein HRbin33_00156 [bacterium HR33]
MQPSSAVLGAGFLLFLLLIGFLVASALAPREVAVFDPSPPGQRQAGTLREPRTDTVTVDARDARAWRFFDLDRGMVLESPDTAGWDLAFRRFHIIAAAGILDLETTDFESSGALPAAGYQPNVYRSDTLNPAIARWYSYSMLTHLLKSKERVYAVPTSDGRYAKLQILSYYCTGVRAGCLTFRYRYPVPAESSPSTAPEAIPRQSATGSGSRASGVRR